MSAYRAIRRFLYLALVGIAVLGVLLFLSAPKPLPASALPDHTPDIENGRKLFAAAGCASCHAGVEQEADAAKAETSEGEDAKSADGKSEDADAGPPAPPTGGKPFATPVGTFHPPNLTPDEETGIGTWAEVDFVNAVTRGITHHTSHYFPAFPYASYQAMRLEDVLDIFGYLRSLDPVKGYAGAHGIAFSFAFRPFIGLWKRAAMDYAPFADVSEDETVNRGAYLTNAVLRCGECHTPRNAIFVMDRSRWLKGGDHPEGTGKVPDITSTGDIGDWSVEDVAGVLKTGFKPDFSDDISSGGMDNVLKGLKALGDDDLTAIATYLKSLK